MSDDRKCVFVGRVVTVEKTETLGKNKERPFHKRVIVVDDAELAGSKYPNPVPFEATGDKCDYLDKYKKGDEVEITFYPNGRAWEDPKTGKTRYFSSNRIGFIKRVDADGAEPEPVDDGGDGVEADDIDNMPF